MTGLTLGIDIGTSGVRSAVLDTDGQVISSARAAHPQQDPSQIDAGAWWTAVKTCLQTQSQALLSTDYRISDVSQIGIDGTSGSMVLTDENLRPVTQALMYNSAGFGPEAEKIAKVAPPIHIAKGSNSALARALRLQCEDTRNAAVHLLHQADYIAAVLMGQGGFSDANNTLKLGYDPDTNTWPDWIGDSGLRTELLPQVVPAGAPLGRINALEARRLGLSDDTMIHAGTTDSIAAFLAAAPLQVGAAVTSLGTTLAIKILSDMRIDRPEIGLYSHKVGEFWLAGGASNTGGGVLAQLFGPTDLQQLSTQIDATQPSAQDYYPLNAPGERFPINDPNLAPRMGPRPDSDADFLHGLLESMARIEAQCYRAIKDDGGPDISLLMTAGGGAQNPTWTQIRARVLGVTPLSPAQTEASVGIARLVLQNAN